MNMFPDVIVLPKPPNRIVTSHAMKLYPIAYTPGASYATTNPSIRCFSSRLTCTWVL